MMCFMQVATKDKEQVRICIVSDVNVNRHFDQRSHASIRCHTIQASPNHGLRDTKLCWPQHGV